MVHACVWSVTCLVHSHVENSVFIRLRAMPYAGATVQFQRLLKHSELNQTWYPWLEPGQPMFELLSVSDVEVLDNAIEVRDLLGLPGGLDGTREITPNEVNLDDDMLRLQNYKTRIQLCQRAGFNPQFPLHCNVRTFCA